MRVLHVSAYYAPAFVYGGPPRSIHGLCKALTAAGVEVQVATTDANGSGRLPSEVTSARTYDGVAVRYFSRSWPNEPIGSRALSAALPQMLDHVDVVHIHGLWNRVVWAAARAARRAQVPYVLSPRGMLQGAALAHRSWRKRIAHAAIEHRTIEGAALLHATSSAERDTLRMMFPASHVALIPNGIEVGQRRTSAGLPLTGSIGDEPFVLFVGRLHGIKRLDLLIDAFDIVKRTHTEAVLIVAGPDEQGLWHGLMQRHPHLAADVRWIGPVDPAARDALMGQARALVVCSDSESFGMTVLEAMAVACPVVVTTTCGWEEIEHEGAGVRVEQSADAIAGALCRLLANRDLALSMGERGRELALRCYTWSAVADRFAACYREIFARKASRAIASGISVGGRV